MNEITASYPDFVPNQVLTNTQLNNLRDYLDQQDHLTRVRLIGTGIVCGLTWSFDHEKQNLTIYEGFGLTSYDGLGLPDGGYLIEHVLKKYKHYRSYNDPDIDDDGNPRYEPWQRSGDLKGQIDIFELLEETTTGSTALDFKIINDRVLVLYVEKKGVDLNSCLVTECDNKGLNINLNVRVLLVKKADLKEIPLCSPTTVMQVPRLHKVVKLDEVNTASAINNGYKEIIYKLIDPLMKNIKQQTQKYAGFLDVDLKIDNKLKTLLGIIESANKDGKINQYHYDFIKDVVCAYNEFVTAACELLIDCCPLYDFERHLMLGAIDRSSRYRHEFIASPVRNVMHGDLERIRGLLVRIFEMIDSFVLTETGQIRITPSHNEVHPLGKRAVPFYYKFVPELKNYWQPKLCCTTDTLWSYQEPIKKDRPGADIDLDYTRCSLMRIEGHLGMQCDAASKAIAEMRSTHNVEFDLVNVFLTDRSDDEDELLRDINQGQTDIFKIYFKIRRLIAQMLAKPEDAEKLIEEIDKGFEHIKELEQKLAESNKNWMAMRRSRWLLCKTAHLEADYLCIRGELISVLNQLLDLVEGIKIISAPGWAAKIPDVYRFGLFVSAGFAARFLAEQIKWVLNSFLPKEIAGFNYGPALDRCKRIMADLIWYGLMWPELVDLLREQGVYPDFPRFEWGSADNSYGFLKVLRDKLVNNYLAYEYARNRYLGVFNNLAKRAQGLEHLAGVEKGGTFVLVCDDSGKDEQIVADFALSCCVSCQCDLSPGDICLPPFAQPDSRVVPLKADKSGKVFEPIDIQINVLDNDYDQNLNGESKLHISLFSNESELAAKIKVVDPELGTISYINENPIPMVVDRFSYTLTLKNKKCPGQDIGEVLVLPIPAPGVIRGIVRRDNSKKPVPYADVSIIERKINIKTNVDGKFIFSDLLPGIYTLQASLPYHISDEVKVDLKPGATEDVVLEIRPLGIIETGTIRGTVVDRKKEPVPGADVQVLDTDHKMQTRKNGSFEFVDLPEGTYKLQASKGEFTSESADVALKPGATETVTLVLGPVIDAGFFIPANFVKIVAESNNLPVFEAQKKVDKIFSPRYLKYVETMTVIGKNPAIARSEAFKGAKKFLREAVTAPDLKETQIIELFLSTSTTLARAIKAASAVNKTSYSDLLGSVGLAFLDRLLLSNPMSLGEDTKKALTTMKETLKSAGLDVKELVQAWQGDALMRNLKISAPEEMIKMMS